ncbi:hypothetical protein LYZ93_09995, partial [Xanthomonas hortorum pv. vitians]|nr:hypothetical protein [Xanthomonas hortorum pv. vitians]
GCRHRASRDGFTACPASGEGTTPSTNQAFDLKLKGIVPSTNKALAASSNGKTRNLCHFKLIR